MKWFREIFLPSFEDCEAKRISEKQAEIFKRYLSDSSESNNAIYYKGTVSNRTIKVQESLVYNGCRYTNKGRRTSYRKEHYLTIVTKEI